MEAPSQSSLYELCRDLCSFRPQDASGNPALFPTSTRICNWCSVACIILALLTHFSCEYSDTRPVDTVEDNSSTWYTLFTASVAFAGLFYEVSITVSIMVMGMSDRYQEDLLFRKRLRLNQKMICIYFFLTVCYIAMTFDFHVIHRSWISDYYGGDQIVYSIRYAEWILGASMVMAVNGQMDHTSDRTPRNGIIPSSVLTGVLCITGWQGLVVKNLYFAWSLIGFSFVCFFVSASQQLMFACFIKDKGCSGQLRARLIAYIVVAHGIYGVLYLLPIFGWISPHFQNKIFCLGDASFALWTSCMVCATNDVAANDELCRSALATAADIAQIIQTASVPIFGVDVESNINEWNLKTAQLTGISKEEVMGTPLIRMIGSESQQNFRSMLTNALNGDEEVGRLETSFFPTEQGPGNMVTQKPMLMLSAAATKDGLGEVKGVTFVGCDLTEATVFKEAEVRKVRFLAVVSHELRSPLNGIIGLMEYFTDGEVDPKKLRYVDMVKNCATRLLDLVMNIMEVASMVSKSAKDPALQLSHDPVELNKIVDEVLVLVNKSFDKSGKRPLLRDKVSIFNNMDALPIIEADAHKCTQVLYNIITNACKFTSKGSITISSNVDLEGEWVEVIVADTGRGIEAASLQRIFEPFEQTDSPIATGHQGIGLGLSIACDVVKRHGGRIQVQSRVGVGSMFTVRLPTLMAESSLNQSRVCIVGKEKPEPVSSAEEVTVSEPCKSHDKKPLLLSVDDDPVNQEIVKHMLGDLYDIDIAMDGEEAIEYLKSAKVLPEVLLLDVMMPGMSGIEVCAYVRRELRISEVKMPILMLSASLMGSTLAEALDAGANSYMFKPFEKSSLTAQVQSASRMKSLAKRRFSKGSSARCSTYCSEAATLTQPSLQALSVSDGT